MNIFNSIKIYAGKWQVKEERNFSAKEIAAVAKTTVVKSQYGLSACFFLHGGGMSFIPMDENSSASEGDVIDLSKAKIKTLAKDGEDDIYRVMI